MFCASLDSRPELCLLPSTAVAAAAAAAAQQRHLLKKQMQAEGEVVAKKEAPRSRTGSVDSGQGGPPAKAVNGRVSADTDETMSNSSLSTLSGKEPSLLFLPQGWLVSELPFVGTIVFFKNVPARSVAHGTASVLTPERTRNLLNRDAFLKRDPMFLLEII